MGHVKANEKIEPRTIDPDIIFSIKQCLEPNLWINAFRVIRLRKPYRTTRPRRGNPSKMLLIAWHKTPPFGFTEMVKFSRFEFDILPKSRNNSLE